MVTVTDAHTGLHVCDASVTTSDGVSTYDRTTELPAADADAAATSNICVYYPDFGNGKQNITYTVTVSAPGYQSAQLSDFIVSLDSCGNPTSQRSATVMLNAAN